MLSVRNIGIRAFTLCNKLSDLEWCERLDTIQRGAFNSCPELKRIVLPLKDNMIEEGTGLFAVFDECPQLATVELVGWIHSTVASLHMESWRIEMMDEINRVNQVLPNIGAEQKTGAIRQWMESVIRKHDH